MPAYCTIAEISTLGVPAAALQRVLAPDLQREIGAASDEIDGYLRNAFALPLSDWGVDIRRACAVIAGYNALAVRGFNPEGETGIVKRYDDTIAWLKMVAKGAIRPSVTDSTPGHVAGNESGGARVVTSTSRGWSSRGTGNSPIPFGRD